MVKKSLLLNLLEKENLPFKIKENVIVLEVSNQETGLLLAKNLLYKFIDLQTLLFLSGGKTPKNLYQSMSFDEKLTVGAVALIDERFGKPLHDNSNEKMIQETGLISYLNKKGIPFYGILKEGLSRKETAREYEDIIKKLMISFSRKIAILGIGVDGHTAGIAPNRADYKNPLFDKTKEGLFVSEFNDEVSSFKERVTLTFKALEEMELLFVLAFGKEKEQALKQMFTGKDVMKVPARFLNRENPSKLIKTILITDQKV